MKYLKLLEEINFDENDFDWMEEDSYDDIPQDFKEFLIENNYLEEWVNHFYDEESIKHRTMLAAPVSMKEFFEKEDRQNWFVFSIPILRMGEEDAGELVHMNYMWVYPKNKISESIDFDEEDFEWIEDNDINIDDIIIFRYDRSEQNEALIGKILNREKLLLLSSDDNKFDWKISIDYAIDNKFFTEKDVEDIKSDKKTIRLAGNPIRIRWSDLLDLKLFNSDDVKFVTEDNIDSLY